MIAILDHPQPMWARVGSFLGLFKYLRFRQLLGGRWELWWNHVTCSYIWYHYTGQPKYSSWDKTRPACCFGTPTIEEHAKLPHAMTTKDL